jgi:hypothetical protein
MQMLAQLLPLCLEDIAEVLESVLLEVPARIARTQLLVESLSKASGIEVYEAALALREMASLDPAQRKAYFQVPPDGLAQD